MTHAFQFFFNNSMAAGWLILVVILLRLVFRKGPKNFRCILWLLVGIRILCPISIESAVSLIPSSKTIPHNFGYMQTPAIDSGIGVVNGMVNPLLEKADALLEESHGVMFPIVQDGKVDHVSDVIEFLAWLWAFGVVILLVTTIKNYKRIYKMVKASIPIANHVYICDYIHSPFIFGILRADIYVPSTLEKEYLKYVLAHEEAHLKRHDNWWKPLGYLLVILCWFHPLVWLAYWLLCKDLELSCDEKVIAELDTLEKANYSQVLLSCSKSQFSISSCPVAFGEGSVKERVKEVLRFQKPARWICALAVLMGIAVTVCFLTNPIRENISSSDPFAQADTPYQWTKNIQAEDINLSWFQVTLWQDLESKEDIPGGAHWNEGSHSKVYVEELVEILNDISEEEVVHGRAYDSCIISVTVFCIDAEGDTARMDYHLQYDGEKVSLMMDRDAAELYLDYPYEQWILESEELEAYMLRMGRMVQDEMKK